jgi:hypothetical protein
VHCKETGIIELIDASGKSRRIGMFSSNQHPR